MAAPKINWMPIGQLPHRLPLHSKPVPVGSPSLTASFITIRIPSMRTTTHIILIELILWQIEILLLLFRMKRLPELLLRRLHRVLIHQFHSFIPPPTPLRNLPCPTFWRHRGIESGVLRLEKKWKLGGEGIGVLKMEFDFYHYQIDWIYKQLLKKISYRPGVQSNLPAKLVFKCFQFGFFGT